MSKEKSIATEALIGMGRMYGPIRPVTKAMGMSAAITVKVARMIGARTSFIAPMINLLLSKPTLVSNQRWMFSTSTIGSSTKIPMQKIRAKRVTLFKVNPNIMLKNKAIAKVTGTAMPTTKASLTPRTTPIKRMTAKVAMKRCSRSSFAFSLAVSP